MVDAENLPLPNELSSGIGLIECETTAGLPSQFVKSMRTLFNMMDDTGSGKVALSEIERRWRDDAVPNLPGVLDALRALAPAKGFLTFENFVSGLSLALHRTRTKSYQRGSGTAMQNFGFQQQKSIYNQPRDRNPIQRAPSHLCNRHLERFRNRDIAMARGVYDRSTAINTEYRDNRTRFKHRRSNSGPIYTGKSIADSMEPTLPHGIISADDSFVDTNRIKSTISKQIRQFETKVQSRQDDASHYGNGKNNIKVLSDSTNIGARSSPSGCDSPSLDSAFQSLSQENTPSPIKNDCQDVGNNLSNDRLFCDNENAHVISVKPVVVSGKYIGITGTLQKTKSMASIANKQYGSLPRRATRSSAATSFSQLPYRESADKSEERQPVFNSKSDFADPHPRKRSIPKRTDGFSGIRSSNEESYSRSICDSSPQDVPVEKLARKVTTKSGISSYSQDPSMARSACGSDQAVDARRRRNGSQTSRRRSARWNTTGVNFNTVMLKRLKTIQQKEDLLRKGMATADGIRTVFLRALMGVEDERTKLETEVDPLAGGVRNSVSQSKQREQSTVANSVMTAMTSLEHIVSEFQLLEMSSKNIASDTSSAFQSLNVMQEKNRRLSKEVSEKSDVIRQLEEEKAALVRQLFQARSELQQCEGIQANTSIFI